MTTYFPNQDDRFATFVRLALIFVAASWLSSSLIGLATGHPSQTTLGYVASWGLMKAGTDSWQPMQEAIEYVRHYPGASIYNDIFFGKRVKFQYPPSSLIFLDIPGRIAGIDWDTLISLTNIICHICVPAIGVAAFLVFKSETDRWSRNAWIGLSGTQWAVLGLVSILVVLSFYPVTSSYRAGQIQTLITLLVCGAFLAWQKGKLSIAGILAGICCAIKPQWVMLIVWGMLRRQWAFVIAATATSGTLFLLAAIMYGPENILDYFSVLSFLSRHGESYHPNQSVNGLLHRLLFNGNNLNWQAHDFPPYHPAVHWLTVVSSAGLLAAALFLRSKQVPETLDLALMILTLTLASPIAWWHHYGVLLPILAVVVPGALSTRAFGRWTIIYLWISMILVSQKLDGIFNTLADSRLNLMQSYVFFGALMILGVIYRILFIRRVHTITPNGYPLPLHQNSCRLDRNLNPCLGPDISGHELGVKPCHGKELGMQKMEGGSAVALGSPPVAQEPPPTCAGRGSTRHNPRHDEHP